MKKVFVDLYSAYRYLDQQGYFIHEFYIDEQLNGEVVVTFKDNVPELNNIL